MYIMQVLHVILAHNILLGNLLDSPFTYIMTLHIEEIVSFFRHTTRHFYSELYIFLTSQTEVCEVYNPTFVSSDTLEGYPNLSLLVTDL